MIEAGVSSVVTAKVSSPYHSSVKIMSSTSVRIRSMAREAGVISASSITTESESGFEREVIQVVSTLRRITAFMLVITLVMGWRAYSTSSWLMDFVYFTILVRSAEMSFIKHGYWGSIIACFDSSTKATSIRLERAILVWNVFALMSAFWKAHYMTNGSMYQVTGSVDIALRDIVGVIDAGAVVMGAILLLHVSIYGNLKAVKEEYKVREAYQWAMKHMV